MGKTKQLDAAQKVAVNHINGPFLCIAGPGSGKTTVIVNRVKHLVDSGINPQSILVVTFSKDAALEMESRYSKLPGAIYGPRFSTIHAFSFLVVRNFYGYTIDNLFTEAKQYGYVNDQIKSEKVTGLKKSLDMKKVIANVISELSSFRNVEYGETFKTKTFRKDKDFLAFFNSYTNYKKANNLIDYDDMLFLCRDIFRSHPEHLKLYQDYYQYLMIDEFQDTSAVQAEILYKLAEPLNNIFICGDDDQSIYRFRGARPDIMLNFEKQYPGCRVTKLVTNYRSDKAIITAASNLIWHNTVRFDKAIQGNSQDLGMISQIQVADNDVNDKMLELIKTNLSHTPLYEMAILARTNKEVSSFAKLLSDNNIPFYCTIPTTNIHDCFSFKLIMNYLNLIYLYDDFPWDLTKEIINKPFRGISNANIKACNNINDLYMHVGGFAVKNIREFQKDIKYLRSLVKAKKKLLDVVSTLLVTIPIAEHVRNTCEYCLLDESEQLDAIKQALKEMEKYDTFLQYSEFVNIQDRVFKTNIKKNKENKNRGITVSTLHRAKGLEYDIVYIPSCNDGNLPYYNKNNPLTDSIAEEERRLMYVGITRARKECFIFENVDGEPSPYLEEVKENRKKEGQTRDSA